MAKDLSIAAHTDNASGSLVRVGNSDLTDSIWTYKWEPEVGEHFGPFDLKCLDLASIYLRGSVDNLKVKVTLVL